MCYESRNLSKGHLIYQRNNSDRNYFKILQVSTKEKKKRNKFLIYRHHSRPCICKVLLKEKTENQDNTVLIVLNAVHLL